MGLFCWKMDDFDMILRDLMVKMDRNAHEMVKLGDDFDENMEL